MNANAGRVAAMHFAFGEWLGHKPDVAVKWLGHRPATTGLIPRLKLRFGNGCGDLASVVDGALA